MPTQIKTNLCQSLRFQIGECELDIAYYEKKLMTASSYEVDGLVEKLRKRMNLKELLNVQLSQALIQTALI